MPKPTREVPDEPLSPLDQVALERARNSHAREEHMSKTLNELIAKCNALEAVAHRALLALDEEDFPQLRQDLRDALSIEDDEPEDEICPGCSGSGEGMWDGATCNKCHGSGTEPVEKVDEP